MIVRALMFLLVFTCLQMGWQSLDGSSLHDWLIDRGVVEPAALVGRALTPGLGVYAAGARLREATGGLNIVNGCDGTETLFLLVAAFCVAPLGWGSRLRGIVAGAAVVYLVNLLRILTLFYARRSDLGLFDVLHGVVTPVIMVVAIAGFYFLWLQAANKSHDRLPG